MQRAWRPPASPAGRRATRPLPTEPGDWRACASSERTTLTTPPSMPPYVRPRNHAGCWLASASPGSPASARARARPPPERLLRPPGGSRLTPTPAGGSGPSGLGVPPEVAHPVADPPDSLDQVALAAQLAPQAQHRVVDRPVARAASTPHRVHEVAPAERPAGRAHQQLHHLELVGGRSTSRASTRNSWRSGSSSSGPCSSRPVSPPAGRPRSAPDPIRPPQERPDAGDQLAHAEGLGQVVVGADLEPQHPVDLVGARGEHQHRRRGLGAEGSQHRQPVETRQHPVEHHQVRSAGAMELQRGHAVGGAQDVVPVRAQLTGDDLGQIVGVLVRAGSWS